MATIALTNLHAPPRPDQPACRPRLVRAAVLLLVVGNFCAAAAPDPAKVQGPTACGECHKSEVEAWKTTHHFETLNKMHREPKAREIADKLGIKRIKSEAVCLHCHYTSKLAEDKPEVIAGISCESCHGAAQGWIKVHNDYGGTGAKKENETPEHRAQRIASSVAAGMIRSQETYTVAANCFGCHTVPEEDLVNAGHPPGSDFELVAWSQGEVRHNFLPDPKANAQPSPAHKRMLFVVGRILDLEFSLRSAAKATKEGTFAAAMKQRVNAALANLKEVDKLAGSGELKEIIAAGGAAEPKINNAAALNAAADKVAALGKSYSKAGDGTQLAAVDSLLPAADKLKGKSYQP
jgi:hypothetical protein